MIAGCTKCHHEWQQVGPDVRDCDWCGAPGEKLGNDWIETMDLKKVVDECIEQLDKKDKDNNDE